MSKKASLDAVASEVIGCIKCPLWKGRKKAVPGEGSPTSRIMLIGEAPGSSEDAKGKPFVGIAGRFLNVLLQQAGLSRRQVFITNVVKCRPPRNRPPRRLEIETCTPYLDRQLLIVRPDFIISLGSHSTSYIFSKAMLHFTSITKARGNMRRTSVLGLKLTIFPTFHPASALYNSEYKETLNHDFQSLKKKLSKIEESRS